MKRMLLAAGSVLALLLAAGCSDPVGGSNSSGGNTPAAHTVKVTFESFTSGDAYNPGTGLTKVDSAATPALDTDIFADGASSLKVTGTLQEDKYGTAKEMGIRIKAPQIFSGTTDQTVNMLDKIVTLKMYVPADSKATGMQFVLGGGADAISQAVSLTPGQWNTLYFKADSGHILASNSKVSLDQIDAQGAVLASGAYTSPDLDLTAVKEFAVRLLVVGTDTGVIGDAVSFNIDSLDWADTASFGATSSPSITDTSTAGTGVDKVTVTLTAGTSGADKIYYTTDGNDPTTASTQYSAPFDITVTGTVLKVLAVKTGLPNSTIVSKTYTILPSRNVTFDLNYVGATGAPAAQKIGSGTTATAPTAPIRTGFTFLGWFTEAAGTNQFAFTTAVTADLTLYAKWSSSIVSYNVDFDLNYVGATGAPATQAVVSGNLATAPATPVQAGFIFKGWYTEAATTTAFSFTTAITAPTTLYAKWIPGAAVTFSAATVGGSGAVAAAPTYNADGSATYVANYQYGGGGANFYVNADKSAVDLTSFTSVVVKYSVTASRPSVTNNLVVKAFTAAGASYWTSSAVGYTSVTADGDGTYTVAAPYATAGLTSVYALGLCLNNYGYTGDTDSTTAAGNEDGVASTFDSVTITVKSIELLK